MYVSNYPDPRRGGGLMSGPLAILVEDLWYRWSNTSENIAGIILYKISANRSLSPKSYSPDLLIFMFLKSHDNQTWRLHTSCSGAALRIYISFCLCVTQVISTLSINLCWHLNFQMESSCVSIHEVLKVVADSQTWYRLREAHDRTRAEHLLERVTYWSIGETVLLFVIGIGQVVLLRSFFVEKKGSVASAT